jgi:putative tryptophan/tyrosine transport system substrate-binding protein
VRRRDFIALAGGAAVALALGSEMAAGQGTGKVRRLGILSQGSLATHPTPVFQALLQGLHELGWTEGQNLAMEWRFSEGSFESLPMLASELASLPLDLIVASPTRPALAVKEATRTIPVVFIQVADPIRVGIVGNLARPGGNVTGLSSIAADLTGKRLALLKEVLPDAGRVAVLWNRPSEGAALVFHEMERMTEQLGLELLDIAVADSRELPDAIAAAVQARVAAIMVIDDPVMTSYHRAVMRLAGDHALPVFSQYSEYVDGGAVMAYGPSLPALYRRGAVYVDRILRGAKPGDLPVEQPAVFELVINLRAAKALGLELAPTLVARADRVIE